MSETKSNKWWGILLVVEIAVFIHMAHWTWSWFFFGYPYAVLCVLVNQLVTKATLPRPHSMRLKTMLADGSLQWATMNFTPEALVITTPGNSVSIPFDEISTILFENKTADSLPMAGFGISYHVSTVLPSSTSSR